MSALDIWLTIGLLLAATLLARGSFFLIGQAVRLPPKVQHALRYAPAAALSAIVAPDLLMNGGTAEVSWHNPRLLAAIVATVFFLGTRHLLGTILVGMAAFFALRHVL